MKSTRDGAPAAFLGVDPTDRYAKRPKACAVCGLDPVEGLLIARFWTWEWPARGEPLEVAGLLEEVRAARATLIDGPQGLAAAGRSVRQAEEHARTPGRTPDALPEPGAPYAGYIRSSVELFAALYRARVRISPTSITGGVGEVDPGGFWSRFEGLPKKTTKAGRMARAAALEALGVRPPKDHLPSHDELDACVAALGAAAAAGVVRGVYARARGGALSLGPDGLLREGPIVEIALHGPQIGAAQAAIKAALAPSGAERDDATGATADPADGHSGLAPESAGPAKAVLAPSRGIGTKTRHAGAQSPGLARGDDEAKGDAREGPFRSAPVAGPVKSGSAATPEAPPDPPDDPAVRAAADALLDDLVAALRRGHPKVLTYATAYALLHPGRPPSRWLPSMAREVVAAAMHSKRVPLEGLGSVALDTFVVDSVTARPGRGHWAGAAYDVEAWRAVFGLATQAGVADVRRRSARPSTSRSREP